MSNINKLENKNNDNRKQFDENIMSTSNTPTTTTTTTTSSTPVSVIAAAVTTATLLNNRKSTDSFQNKLKQIERNFSKKLNSNFVDNQTNINSNNADNERNKNDNKMYQIIEHGGHHFVRLPSNQQRKQQINKIKQAFKNEIDFDDEKNEFNLFDFNDSTNNNQSTPTTATTTNAEKMWSIKMKEAITLLKKSLFEKEKLLNKLSTNLITASMKLIYEDVKRELDRYYKSINDLEIIFKRLNEMKSMDIKLDALLSDMNAEEKERVNDRNNLFNVNTNDDNNNDDNDNCRDFDNNSFDDDFMLPLEPQVILDENISMSESFTGAFCNDEDLSTPNSPLFDDEQQLPQLNYLPQSTPQQITHSDTDTDTKNSSDYFEIVKIGDRQYFKCKLPGCSKIVSCRESLLRHQQTPHSFTGKMYACNQCPKQFHSNESLRSHLGFHTKTSNSLLRAEKANSNNNKRPIDNTNDNNTNNKDIDPTLAKRKAIRPVLPPEVITKIIDGVAVRHYQCPYDGCKRLFSFRSSNFYQHRKIHIYGDQLNQSNSSSISNNKGNESNTDNSVKPENNEEASDEVINGNDTNEMNDNDDEEFNESQMVINEDVETNNSNSPTKQYRCRLCSRKFPSQHSLNSHFGHHRRHLSKKSFFVDKLRLQSINRKRSSTSKSLSSEERSTILQTALNANNSNSDSKAESNKNINNKIDSNGQSGFFTCVACRQRKYTQTLRKNNVNISCSGCSRFFSGAVGFPEQFYCYKTGMCCKEAENCLSGTSLLVKCRACRLISCLRYFKISTKQFTKLQDCWPKTKFNNENIEFEMKHLKIVDGDNLIENELDVFDNEGSDQNIILNTSKTTTPVKSSPSSSSTNINFKLVTCTLCNCSKLTDKITTHYGQVSCNRCFDFYRRFIRDPKILFCNDDFVCSKIADNTPTRSVINCKACLLRKCIDLYKIKDEVKANLIDNFYPRCLRNNNDEDENNKQFNYQLIDSINDEPIDSITKSFS